MLNQSTVSICRKYLTKEIKEVNDLMVMLAEVKTMRSIYGRKPSIGERKSFAKVARKLKAVKARRKKLEAAIRDLKYNMEGRKQS